MTNPPQESCVRLLHHFCPSNGFRSNLQPQSTTDTCQVGRRARAVRSMRVRRATARGRHNPSARKAGRFRPKLCAPCVYVKNDIYSLSVSQRQAPRVVEWRGQDPAIFPGSARRGRLPVTATSSRADPGYASFKTNAQHRGAMPRVAHSGPIQNVANYLPG